MSLIDKFKAFLKSDKLDVSARFKFSREAISGTMSKFRRADDLETGRTIGLKILDEEKRTTFEERFKGLKKPSEGEIALKFKHPNIVETYEFGLTTNNERYIIMEFIEGTGLNTLIANSDLKLKDRRIPLIRQMITALGAVHTAGYIHRDICPRNFILSADYNTIKLIDFGLTLPDEAPYRLPGNRTGTPLYMAPEIVRRRSTDRRVDIFALGVTFYRLMTFHHPWPGSETSGKAALQHDTDESVPITKLMPKMNQKLADMIMRAIEPEPSNRFESCDAMLKAISGVEKETKD